MLFDPRRPRRGWQGACPDGCCDDGAHLATELPPANAAGARKGAGSALALEILLTRASARGGILEGAEERGRHTPRSSNGMSACGMITPHTPFCPWRDENLSPSSGRRVERMRSFIYDHFAASEQVTPQLHARRATPWKRAKWWASWFLVSVVDYTVSRKLNLGL